MSHDTATAFPRSGILYGPNGLRAGWRIAIFILLIFLMSASLRFVRHNILHVPRPDVHAPLEPVHEIYGRGLSFLLAALAAAAMARIEKQRWGSYGLPLQRAFRSEFWFGILWGAAGVSLVMAALSIAGVYHIDGLALFGAPALKFAFLWGVAFLFVALLEEFLLRGYLQCALASAIGFWPSAVILSGLFLAGHLGNPGENWMGLTDVFLFGIFACFTLWRTGSLWFAVGVHAAWDWGLTYFYSVPDSGTVAVGHLFNIRTQGPAWLSGGSAGPEGSAINLVFDLIWFVIFALIYRKRQWVSMDDRRPAPPGSIEPTPFVDPSALSS
jgi:membrane protease YdiL (CAAX protease family)